MTRTLMTALFTMAASTAFADAHGTPMVTASDQSVENGIVSANKIAATKNGWLVVHRTDAEMAPGPVVAHAPIRKGETPMLRPS